MLASMMRWGMRSLDHPPPESAQTIEHAPSGRMLNSIPFSFDLTQPVDFGPGSVQFKFRSPERVQHVIPKSGSQRTRGIVLATTRLLHHRKTGGRFHENSRTLP